MNERTAKPKTKQTKNLEMKPLNSKTAHLSLKSMRTSEFQKKRNSAKIQFFFVIDGRTPDAISN